MAEKRITHAMQFRNAVWEAPRGALNPVQRLVLLCFADHCRDGAETAWVTWDRLQDRCGMRSRSTVQRVLEDLEKAGWLTVENEARLRTTTTVYRLVLVEDPRVRPARPRTGGRQSGSTSGPEPKIAPGSILDGSGSILDGSGSKDGPDWFENRDPLSGEDSQKTSPAGLSPPGSAPATPSESEPPASVTVVTLSAPAIEAKARLAALLAGKRSAKVSRWNTPRIEEPNPHYNPKAALRLVSSVEEGVA